MVPSSPAKRKCAGVPRILKSVVPLKTCPVGVPVSTPFPEGMVTTSACGVPAALYRVESPVPLSEIHQGPVGLKDIPQALTRLASVLTLMLTMSEVRIVGWVFWAAAGRLNNVAAASNTVALKSSREAVWDLLDFVLNIVPPSISELRIYFRQRGVL